jgi:hypothetical protein
MTRRPFTLTPTAVAVQTASLLLVAGCVFSILISDITRHGSPVPSAEAVPAALIGGSAHLTNAARADLLAGD